ncbi:MAG: PEP-CTERM sorting domain-containing protein [Planctomycetes bacterium]|nr:PEP-CTERM sorting domain-containing protein [Planctomycetota bacterium]
MLLALSALALAMLAFPASLAAGQLDEIWDLEAVDMAGVGTHPSLGRYDDDPAAWVTFRGVVLNEPNDMLNTNMQWQMYVQALPGNPAPYDRGGIALYANRWYGGPANHWPRYSTDYHPGDVVEVHGLMMNYNGKVNLNERHWPENVFTITKLSSGPVPQPQLIPSIAACNYFDVTDADGDGRPDRTAGGERYQGQWCRLEGVRVTDASGWGNGGGVPITDDSGGTLTMFCGYMGDFDVYTAPRGKFNVTAIFDQEDTSSQPWHDGYRIWPLKFSQVEMWGDTNLDGDVDLMDVAAVAANWTGANGPGGKTWDQGDFDKDGDVDLVDVGNMSVNWTGSRDDLAAAAGEEAPLATAAPWAQASYDPLTGRIVVSAANVEYLRIDGPGLLTGDEPDWSFLQGSCLVDDSNSFTGFWAMNNPQTFTGQSIGNVAATGLGYGELTLVYEGPFGSGQVSRPVVPEPTGLALLAAAVAGGIIRRRRPRPSR